MNSLAISTKEFSQMLLSCRPPTGWGNSLAVAHSGGADSTCLLYLLYRWFSLQDGQDGPRQILSLTVNHSLQLGSSITAEYCRQFSDQLSISSKILHIPWSHPPFPNRPERAVETVARSARYRVLLEAMKNHNMDVLAMGHHADDHIETLVMRLARNQLTTNFTPMRRCRRWGMGTSSKGLDWAGSSGMRHWIIRPLLGVSKDRILATCRLHGLHYVDDPTNFQTSLTTRNLVRHYLVQQSLDQDSTKRGATTDEGRLKQAITQIDAIAGDCPDVSRDMPLKRRLYAATSYLSNLQDGIDQTVDQYLVKFTRPSPLSTLLLLPYLGGSIPTPEVQRAIVLRILRFVSPRPWGAPDSEASRRSSSLRTICRRIWGSDQQHKQTFSVGGEVMWTPVLLNANNCIRLADDRHIPREKQGWVASRQPPSKRMGAVSPCMRDISALINSQNAENEFLWDNRFVIKLRPRLLPVEILNIRRTLESIMVVPHGRWQLPKIVWMRAEQKYVTLGGVGLDVQDGASWPLDVAWAKFHWIRSLEAI